MDKKSPQNFQRIILKYSQLCYRPTKTPTTKKNTSLTKGGAYKLIQQIPYIFPFSTTLTIGTTFLSTFAPTPVVCTAI